MVMCMWLRFSIGGSQNQLLNVLKEAEAYPRTVACHCLRSVYQPRYQGYSMTRTQTVGKGGCRMRLLASVALQPRARAAGQESFRARFEGARWSKFEEEFLMKEVRGTPLRKAFPAEADELSRAAENARALQQLQASLYDGVLIDLVSNEMRAVQTGRPAFFGILLA